MTQELVMTPQGEISGVPIKKTKTRCVHCSKRCDGEVWRIDQPGEKSYIVMRKFCPTHGVHDVEISPDADFYWKAQGNPSNACCISNSGNVGMLGANALNPSGLYDKLNSCISLIEIVESCNLSCPTCFSESPLGKQGEHLKCMPLEEIKRRVEHIIATKDKIEILQLSGGEPTLHPDLFELLRWAGAHEKIGFIFLNTNGIRFARDEAFVKGFEEAYPRGKLLLYLQFDGPQEEGQKELRGIDLRPIREEIIARCAAMNLTVMLVMTVTELNLPHVYKTVEYALKHRIVRAAHFQPVFLSGRIPSTWSLMDKTPISTAHVIQSLIDGSKGLLSSRDFTPLPCGDPNCHAISGVLRPKNGPIIPLGAFVKPELLGAIADKIHYEIDDLIQCGCDNTELGETLKALAIGNEDVLAISIKPFMDPRSWDEDRTDRCCTHVITAKGLQSFCKYYSGFPDL